MWESECKSHHATKEALKVAIQALEQIEEEIDSPNRGTCDYFIVDRIEEIIDNYKEERKMWKNENND